jgi:hypothetical protein
MPQEIVVSVDPERAADVAERLRAAGMEVTEVLLAIGVVTGSAPASRVEPARRIDLPPPDSPVQ